MSEVQSPVKQIELNIVIVSAKLTGFEITPIAENLENQLPQDKYEYQILPSFKFDNEKEVEIIIKVLIFNLETKDELCSIKTHFNFIINNLKETAKIENNTINMPLPIIATLIGMSVSTTRGMLIMCTSNSILANAILPPFDANKLLLVPPQPREIKS